MLAESRLKGVALRIWPLNPMANGRNFDADLAKTVQGGTETAKQGFSLTFSAVLFSRVGQAQRWLKRRWELQGPLLNARGQNSGANQGTGTALCAPPLAALSSEAGTPWRLRKAASS